MTRQEHNELVVYMGSQPENPVHIAFDGETLWLTQDQIARLFETSRPNIVQHIQNIYKDEELDPEATSKKILQVVENGRKYPVQHYNLDIVISVGYRVSSKVATKFRQWATQVIKERVAHDAHKGLNADEQRVLISDRIAVENNDLVNSALSLGADDIAVFLNAGYQGMYEMKMNEIKKKKGLGRDRLLDRAGVTELAANEFRITQTNAILKELKEEDGNLVGDTVAKTTHWQVGREVREAIGRIGGKMPEEIEVESDHIDVVRRRILKLHIDNGKTGELHE
jgi:phage terminase Nu1 subunit (DNA packaging protein)